MKRIAIFASGSGSNAQRIVEYFSNNPSVKIPLILSNKANAFVLERAEKLGIPAVVFSREEFYTSPSVLNLLQKEKIDLIVLAGFLWLVPENLVEAFPRRIVNIHPALLPQYGGKGMYGHHVHEAVIKNGEKESGITIHFVNENYDEGNTIFQARCKVLPGDTPDTLAERIHTLEYEHFPRIIDELLQKI